MTRIAGLAAVVTSAFLVALSPSGASGQPFARGSQAGDGRAFTIAVVPDTQREVFRSDPRLPDRLNWLIKKKEALDLRFLVQVGDLTNWGWLDPPQLDRASSAFSLLESAEIPYSIAVGNHDTRAVGWNGSDAGYGGSAYESNPECPQRFDPSQCHSYLLVRHTEEINAHFGSDRFSRARGQFEVGKIDNLYSTFRAGGMNWLVLDLELWPRPAAIAWADRVVSDHPDFNVIVNTHSYLTAKDTIYGKADYGSTSPLALWRQFVSRHKNIWLVTCGHTGSAGSRIDRGVDGNKIFSVRTNFDRTRTNQVRLITINPTAGTARTRIYAPLTDTRFPRYARTVKGLAFVPPAR